MQIGLVENVYYVEVKLVFILFDRNVEDSLFFGKCIYDVGFLEELYVIFYEERDRVVVDAIW